jgi:hypothetical protein
MNGKSRTFVRLFNEINKVGHLSDFPAQDSAHSLAALLFALDATLACTYPSFVVLLSSIAASSRLNISGNC